MMSEFFRIATIFFVSIIASACTSHPPYHKDIAMDNNKIETCNKNRSTYDLCTWRNLKNRNIMKELISSEPTCWENLTENHDDYIMHFAEFDDQGWIAGSDKDRVNSSKTDKTSMDLIVDRIRDSLKTGRQGQRVSLVVYVHGWNHTSQANDDDVHEFRDLLKDVARIERANKGHEDTKVVGVFVGWRGESIPVPGVQEGSFWDRKATAEKVAQGSVRELLLRLDAIRDMNKGGKDKPVKEDWLHMLTIGHSFGGLLVYEALSGEFIRSAARAKEELAGNPFAKPKHNKVGDLVVIVNPAFEGTRYEVLRLAADKLYQSPGTLLPHLVIATSEADRATRYAFPAARTFSTILEHDPNEERDANFFTVGHNERFQTHTLCQVGKPNCEATTERARLASSCGQETPSLDRARLANSCGQETPFLDRARLAGPREQEVLSLAAKVAKNKINDTSGTNADPDGSRYFCNLRLTPTNDIGPYWVVKTTGDIMDGHGDIYNENFMTFVALLYEQILRERHSGNERK